MLHIPWWFSALAMIGGVTVVTAVAVPLSLAVLYVLGLFPPPPGAAAQWVHNPIGHYRKR